MPSLALRLGGLLFAGILIGWTLSAWHYDSAYKKQTESLIKQINEAQKKNQQMSDFYNQILNQNQPQQNKVDREVKIEIQKYPVYVDCKYTADGMQSIKSTVIEANQTKSAKRIDATL